jgi:hypothetical protein
MDQKGKMAKVGNWGKVSALGYEFRRKPMTTPAKPAAFLAIAKLPRTPASDLEKLGWRGMMNALQSKGRIVAEYDALMQLVEQSKAQTESALAGLRRSFDGRLSVLQGRSATTRLRSTIRGHAKLGGKVKAGSGY